MNELIQNIDIATRLYLIIQSLSQDSDQEAKILCQDALDEIERLRAEVKKLKYLAKL